MLSQHYDDSIKGDTQNRIILTKGTCIQSVHTHTHTHTHEHSYTLHSYFFYWRISFKSSLSQARNTVHSQSCEKYCIHFALGLIFCNFYSFFWGRGLFCIFLYIRRVKNRWKQEQRFFFVSSHIEKVLIPRCYPTRSTQSTE
jgi:hypothetical protein